MKKETICTECNCIAETNYYCDTCSDNLITKHLGIPITISFGYGSILDGEEYHFCTLKCLSQFIKEQKKEIE
jgi:hypothetical protein